MTPSSLLPKQRGGTSRSRLYLGFALLTVVSCLGLDYLGWRRGEPWLVFSLISPRKGVTEVGAPLAKMIRESLQRSGISPSAVQERTDASGFPEIQVSLPAEEYAKLEPELEKDLRGKKANFVKTTRQDKEKATYSWEVKGTDRDKVSLLFSCLPPVPAKEEEAPPLLAKNRVAIIIDDMGSSLETLQEICDLKEPITISVLPLSLYAEETATIAYENGLEVMLHLPCESLNNQNGNNGTTGLIHSGMTEAVVKAILEDYLGRVPFILGANNHMGSKITQDEPIMRQILEMLKSRELFFLDSRTSADSIAFDLSQKMGLRSAYRNIFLDSTVGLDFSKKKLIELFEIAQKTGQAVGIGHPFPETLQALRESIPLFGKYRIEPVFASQIARKATTTGTARN